MDAENSGNPCKFPVNRPTWRDWIAADCLHSQRPAYMAVFIHLTAHFVEPFLLGSSTFEPFSFLISFSKP